MSWTPKRLRRRSPQTLDAIRLLTPTAGLPADPDTEGGAAGGLRALAQKGTFAAGERILLMHLGGAPALHAFADHFGTLDPAPLTPSGTPSRDRQ